MDNNHMDDYVLVLEDRTEVKNEAEVGKLSVVSNIDEKGKLKTTPAEEANQSDFLKFNSRDGLLKNFMENFLKQFNEPKRLACTRCLLTMWNKAWQISKQCCKQAKSRQSAEDKRHSARFRRLPSSAEEHHSHQPERVDWKMLETLGLSKEKLEQNGDLDKMLNWQKTNLLPIAIP